VRLTKSRGRCSAPTTAFLPSDPDRSNERHDPAGHPTATPNGLDFERRRWPGFHPAPTTKINRVPKHVPNSAILRSLERRCGHLKWLCRAKNASSETEDLVFHSRHGGPLRPDNLRNQVLAPAAGRAGVPGIGLHTLRHTCASLLIERGTSPLRLQRWMGHHAAAYTLAAYGHLVDDELGEALELDRPGTRQTHDKTDNSRQ
jgi:integrase